MAFNAANLTRCSPQNVNGPALYLYYTTEDVATVGAATYFTPFGESINQFDYPFQLNVGDNIDATCSDGFIQMYVTSITPITTTQQTVIDVVGPNSVNTDSIQNLAVTTAKINDLAVTTGKLAANAVTEAKIAAGTITTASISNTAGITGTQLANATVTGAKIAATTVAGSNMVANTVATGQLDPSTIQYVKVPVTAAQWNGMYDAPFIMIAAPGAGKIIVVKQAVLAMTFVAAQYAAGGAVALQYDSTVHGGGILASDTLAAAVVNAYAASSDVSVAGTDTSGASASKVDKGLYLSNDTAAFTTGDGTWQVHIWYEIVTL